MAGIPSGFAPGEETKGAHAVADEAPVPLLLGRNSATQGLCFGWYELQRLLGLCLLQTAPSHMATWKTISKWLKLVKQHHCTGVAVHQACLPSWILVRRQIAGFDV